MLLKTLPYISSFVLFINVLLAFIIIRKRSDLLWFEALLIWALFIEVSAKIMAEMVGNNLPLLHLYTLFEFIFLSLFYQRILIRKMKYKKYFPYFVAVIIILIICNTIFLEPITGFNGNAKGLTQVIIMCYTIIYFFNRISVEIEAKNMVLNRINAAVLLYYAGSLFIFTFAQFLFESSKGAHDLSWIFNAAIYLIFQFLILLATWRIVFSKKNLTD